MKYDNICEMNIEDLMTSLIGQKSNIKTCDIQNPIQPNDDIGSFGMDTHIQVKATEEGGLEVDSKEMAIKISKEVYEAIKTFVQKGDE